MLTLLTAGRALLSDGSALPTLFPTWHSPHMKMCVDKESMLDALYADREGPNPNTEEMSHLHLQLDEETGEPLQARFAYVDEHSCIGCTYCSTTARSTFFMEDDHGRARVYDQGGDSDELVQEAIDACPVNCIHYVSHEDLVILEQEREGQFINNAQRLRSQQEATAFVPPTAAKSFNSGGMRCNNCPSRGCKECPMFGVGDNPVYLARQAERAERRQASGEAQQAEEDQRREALIFEAMAEAEVEADEALEAADANAALFNALWDTAVDVDDMGDGTYILEVRSVQILK